MRRNQHVSKNIFAGGATAQGNTYKNKRGGRNVGPRRSGHPPRTEKQESDVGKQEHKKCKYCGKSCPALRGEGKERCFAYGKECTNCGKKGHFKAVCRAKTMMAGTAQNNADDKAQKNPSSF